MPGSGCARGRVWRWRGGRSLASRRERLLAASQSTVPPLTPDEHVTNIERTLDSLNTRGRTGYYATHVHPHDRAAEIEEEWRFARARRAS